MTLAGDGDGKWDVLFSPLSLVRSSRLKKLKSSLCTSVTSWVSQGPKQSSLTKMSIRSRLRLSKWSQESIARLLVARIDFPKPVQFKNGLHVSSWQDVCSRMFKDIFHLRQEDSTASHLVSQSWSRKNTSTFITFPLLIGLLACAIFEWQMQTPFLVKGPSFQEAGIQYSSYNLRRGKWRKMRRFLFKIGICFFQLPWSWWVPTGTVRPGYLSNSPYLTLHMFSLVNE